MNDRLNHSRSAAWAAYRRHLKKGSTAKRIGLYIFYYLSFFGLLLKIPILGKFISLSRNLFVAYCVEAEHGMLDLTDKLRDEKQSSQIKENSSPVIYDFVIIGSGPGSATAALKLPSGCSIAVIERGNRSSIPQELQHTLSHVVNDFSEAGQELILGAGFPQFAQGSTFGGGSEVNSGLYHRLPAPIKKRFLEESSIPESIWNQSELKIERLLKPEQTKLAETRSVIAQGAQALDIDFANIPRWRKYSSESSFEHWGMLSTVWGDALERENTKFYLSTKAAGVVQLSNGNLEIKLKNSFGDNFSIIGRKLIVSAGTTNTPRLLASSGLLSWSETRFQWHPMFRSIVLCDPNSLGLKDIDPYQAWTKDYSLKFGSAVSTPGLLSLGLGRYITPEESIALRSFYVSFVSSGRGGFIPGFSSPWYKRSDRDVRLAETGKRMLASLMQAAGTKFADSKNITSRSPSTVHIFGSLPINSEIYEKGSLRLKRNPNVFICDGSILPFGPGVNPQAIIMSSVDALFKDFS